MNQQSTVSVTPIEGYPALLMHWAKEIDETDVKSAFKHMNEQLNASSEPLFVVVDIRSSPNFPMRITINEAYWGPFRNPNLREWLVVGSNALAQAIGRTLSSVSRRRNIRWFDTEEEAYAYMQSVTVEESE